jgi:putative ABC transport system substrate-binding protein
MRQRQFLILLGGAAAWPRTVRAQVSSNRPLIVYFAGGSQWNARNYLAAIQEGLQELGYVEGRNIDLVARYGDGRPERLPPLAEEVVRLKPAVIITGAIDTAVATKNVTTTIPIVGGSPG